MLILATAVDITQPFIEVTENLTFWNRW